MTAIAPTTKPGHWSPEAEIAVVGAMLLDRDCIVEACERVSADKFFDPRNQILFSEIVRLHTDTDVTDPILLVEALRRTGKLDAVGGLDYINALQDVVPTVAHVGYHGNVVADHAAKRKMLKGITTLRDAAEGGLTAENLAAELESLAKKTVNFDSAGSPFHDLETLRIERVEWIWPNLIPRGAITVIDGDPNLGKSSAVYNITARVSRGYGMPDGSPGITGNALIISAEDDPARVIKPRLLAAGADLSRIELLREDIDFLLDPVGLAKLRKMTLDGKFDLVTIDPLNGYLGDVNAYKDHELRGRVLRPLSEIAQATGAAIVLIRHLTKSSGAKAVHRGQGSVGISAAARSVILIAEDPDDESGEGKILALIKCNLATVTPNSLKFTIKSRQVSDGGDEVSAGLVVWGGESPYSANQLVSEPENPEERSVLSAAEAFLEQELGKGPVLSKEISDRAKAEKISDRTLSRARAKLKVRSAPTEFGGPRFLSLPDKASPQSTANAGADCNGAQCTPIDTSLSHTNTMAKTEDLGADCSAGFADAGQNTQSTPSGRDCESEPEGGFSLDDPGEVA